MITEILAGYYEPDEQGRKRPESLYGSVKMWAHLNREGIAVAKCTVERLMRTHGWQGVRRLKRVRTTVSDPAADPSAGTGRRNRDPFSTHNCRPTSAGSAVPTIEIRRCAGRTSSSRAASCRSSTTGSATDEC